MTDFSFEDYLFLLKNGADDERRNAAWYLGRQRDMRTVEPLLAALGDSDADVRLRVVEALGNLKESRVVMPLVSALAEDDPRVRAAVIASLGRQGDLRAFQAVLDTLADGDAVVRSAAASALATLNDPRAIPPLVNAMLHDDNADVRYFATRTLQTNGGALAVDALLLALHGEPDADQLIRILELLATLKDSRAADAVQKLTTHDDEGVRETALWAQGQLAK